MYNHLAPKLSLGSPTCWFQGHDPDSDDFVVVMEDLSGHRLCDQVSGCSPADAELVVDALAALHAQWFGNDEPSPTPSSSGRAIRRTPSTTRKPRRPTGRCSRSASASHVPDAMRRVGERWFEIGPALMEETANHPWTLAHGDVRLDNIFFDDANADIKVVDWQISYRNSVRSITLYFMCQSLSVEDRRAHGPPSSTATTTDCRAAG